MNDKSRSYNSIKNIIYSVISQLVLIFVVFFNRTLFIKKLGAEYLGINGLFYNILIILSLAELGVGNVMTYSLYKPIHDKDEDKIVKLLTFYKKIYLIIALIIFMMGIMLIPFLKYLVNSNISLNKIIIYYITFLLNSVFSYFCVHKTTLINADQNIYITKIYTLLFQVLQNIIQIFVLITFNNYLFYLVVQALSTLSLNIFLNIKSEKMYPFIKRKLYLDKSDKTIIIKKIKSTLVYKIGVVIMNNTDNILISIILGTIYVGYYSNYSLIVQTINTLITLAISAMIPSIGNFNVDSSSEMKNKIFNILLLMFHWIVSFCSISLLILINDFIVLWIGKDFIFNFDVIVVIVINFYVVNVISPVYMFRESLGAFERIKYIMILASIINIILSIILGNIFGIAGILVSTVISRFLTTVWYEPIILYKNDFYKSSKDYFKKQLKYIMITFISISIIFAICIFFREINYINFIIKMILCLTIPNIMFFAFVRKSEEFIYLKSKIVSLIKKKDFYIIF